MLELLADVIVEIIDNKLVMCKEKCCVVQEYKPDLDVDKVSVLLYNKCIDEYKGE